MSNSVRPHRRQPTRLPHPWDSLGKNTGVGCHFLLQCITVKSQSKVAQSCPTLSNPMDCSLPGSSIHGIFQARVLEWDAIAFSNMRVCILKNQSVPKNVQFREKTAWLACWLKEKEPVCQCRRCIRSLDQEDPLEKEMATLSSILA